MSDKTGIEWTDATWNPIRGCSRVSEGCRNCYAEGVAYRFSGPGKPFEGLLTLGADGERKRQWNGVIKFVESALLQPLKWQTPRRIFVNSMSDLFHPGVTDEMLDRIFAVMALCPQHTFQVLTKRPERMLAYLSGHGDSHRRNIPVYNAAVLICAGDFSRLSQQMGRHRSSGEGWWPLPNVWLGVSVEDQKAADERIPLLLQTPAAVRFLSCEPLLEMLSLRSSLGGTQWIGGQRGCAGTTRGVHYHDDRCKRGVDWVIVGGESGNGLGIRPMAVDWAQSLVDQCATAGVACFVKQLGSIPMMNESRWREVGDKGPVPLLSAKNAKRVPQGFVPLYCEGKGGELQDLPRALQVRQFPEVSRG